MPKIKVPSKENVWIKVDKEDFEYLNSFTWFLDKDGYARTQIRIDDKQRQFIMHRMVKQAKHGQMIDHINGDRLDNRKENLRICTNSQNQANATSRRGKSKYKGVHKVTKTERWQARIQKDGKRLNLGMYENEEEAALAYNKKAIELFGEYARLNKIS